ncbi:DUF1134 domain-containing protein [Aurantiacibacter sp. MUD11]|uniref:DUF1134 domain-containing protein n=1 Tax=Aurantiacibacter sp. MUD11 TaxID=3003265 RepID=UPI0022AA1806|nr:DUF1134 domain-containing protein [Aurantiacibacter sp. MUD11]WAT17581.1 DUF1134 domain-containing protein [Aurantiacibacter sp. MUD11]
MMRTIRNAIVLAMLPAAAALAMPAAAQQIETVDPDLMIDGDLMEDSADRQAPELPRQGSPAYEDGDDLAYDGAYEISEASPRYESGAVLELPPEEPPPQGTTVDVAQAEPPAAGQTTYAEDDLIGAAEGLFGRGAEGLARLIQDVLADQGEPNGYIVGREGGGAFIFGVRYGSGTLHHAVEGNMPVYWTGPSIGIDAGANAGNTFVLVYNLYDTEDLYDRFPAGEGQAYFVGGFNASYVRRGDIVLIPIRVGAGLRLGVNAGYMRFSRKQRWLPF